MICNFFRAVPQFPNICWGPAVPSKPFTYSPLIQLGLGHIQGLLFGLALDLGEFRVFREVETGPPHPAGRGRLPCAWSMRFRQSETFHVSTRECADMPSAGVDRSFMSFRRLSASAAHVRSTVFNPYRFLLTTPRLLRSNSTFSKRSHSRDGRQENFGLRGVL